jgi:hypothetical protein
MLSGQPRLQSQACMLSKHVAIGLVVQAKIRHAQALQAFDQRVAKLVQDHLRKAVVRVECARFSYRHYPLTVRRGIDFRGALHAKTNATRDRQPNGVEGVQVDVARFSFHCAIVDAMRDRRCPICKEELAERTKNFPFCSARCKLVDAGNWFEGTYRIEAERIEATWGEN